MTCVYIAILKDADEKLGKALEEDKSITDHLICRGGPDFLIATGQRGVKFGGLQCLRLEFKERSQEGLIALLSGEDVDYSDAVCRIYSDPYNTASLVEDPSIGDGFIVEAKEHFRIPEDTFRLHRAISSGDRAGRVFRRSGEESAAADSRILLSRCGQYHPRLEEVLRPFKPDMGAKKLLVLSFSLSSGRITVDNTFKPEAVWMG